VLDFISKADLDVYNEGRTPVLEGDNCFDLKPETLGQFLKMLDKKATDQGWNDASSTQQIGIFNITHDGDPTMISITKDHQYIETSVLRAQCERFMNGKGSQNRASQNNQMMQECIWGSLTLGAKQRIGRFKDDYTLNNLCCGPLLLNIIKRTVSKNSRRRTIVAIRSRLDHIDAYVDEMNGNVKLVTDFFTEHLGQLKSYGAVLYNPMEILFKGLLAVSCEEFHHYIMDVEDMYYAESLTITPEELLLMAQQKHMILKTTGATFTAQESESPSRKDTVQTKAPRSSHRS
jgi:hypothetical protein